MNRVTYSYKMNTCPKCGGKGTLDHYRHVAGGVCFHCNGSGEVRGELVEHMMTLPEMEMVLIEKGIFFEGFDRGCADDDWETALFADSTQEEIAYNTMREKMIVMAFANA